MSCDLLNPWTAEKIGDQRGKTVIITGANSGIGFFVAKYFALAGATVILACRSEKKGQEAVNKLRQIIASGRGNVEGKIELRLLDLSSLSDVVRFANSFNKEGRPLDILINNAGIMMPPYSKTVDGFESQMAANYIGHFVLTQKLMPALKMSSQVNPQFSSQGFPRVVSVSSIIAWRGKQYQKIDFAKDEGLAGATGPASSPNPSSPNANNKTAFYNPSEVYSETKLAALLFMRELGLRYPNLTSVAAHPGVASSNLHQYKFGEFLWAMQSPESGALPIMRAAVDKTARSGAYYAPRGFGYAGYPNAGILPLAARDKTYCRKYWDATAAAVEPILAQIAMATELEEGGGQKTTSRPARSRTSQPDANHGDAIAAAVPTDQRRMVRSKL